MSDVPKRKLIEVALPLEAINAACLHEKSVPRKGHPATLHLWWARRPLAACRAVLFASLVDDPSSTPDEFPSEEEQDAERQRLFRLIERLVTWEATTDDDVLQEARDEIQRSTGGSPPPVLDPFCGGGSIPLEAQRLGLEAHGSDLNPVAVLITKALIEIPPRFAGRPPINPGARERIQAGGWKGGQGLAEDVRYYGAWVRAEAEKRIGHLYPEAELPDGSTATVIAWLWARTVKCPNPACGATMPLVRSFELSKKKNTRTWIEPLIDRDARTVDFDVRTGDGPPPTGTVTRQGARCIVCDEPVALEYVRKEGREGRLATQLMAAAVHGERGRAYVAPTDSQRLAADVEAPSDVPTSPLPEKALGFRVQAYGMDHHRDLFSARQLTALATFSDLVREAQVKAIRDAEEAGLPSDDRSLAEGGAGARALGEAVALYLAFALDKLADWGSTIVTWIAGIAKIRNTFARQAIPMTWDFAEVNPLSDSVGNWSNHVEWVANGALAGAGPVPGEARQLDAARAVSSAQTPLISTDPPYYDNIGYADLSDFFYVWLRQTIGTTYPDLFSTVLTPKKPELVATPFRFAGSRKAAQAHFESGLGEAFNVMKRTQNPEYPLTVFYAFKQAEAEADGLASTGWETMLEALLSAGFGISGTWPMRTERSARSVAIGTAALASSVVLVCRPRPDNAPLATRKEFTAALRSELPDALKHLQQGAIAPVDLAQASIGPGMAVFSRYSKVVEADGEAMRVRTALALINEALDELLAEQEADFDPDTRWCVAWFEQYGMGEGPFGMAETLSRAKNTSVAGLVEAGVLSSAAGKVQLHDRAALAAEWSPADDSRLTVWEVTQHLIRSLETGGERAAAELLRQVGGLAEPARELAYRLFQICDRKKWANEALGYNSLAAAWLEITRLAAAEPDSAPNAPVQEGLGI